MAIITNIGTLPTNIEIRKNVRVDLNPGAFIVVDDTYLDQASINEGIVQGWITVTARNTPAVSALDSKNNISGLVNVTGSTIFQNLSGIINFKNSDGSCPVDLSKLTKTAGATAVSVSGNGTITAGQLAVSDGTNWRQVTNTSLFF